MWNLVKQGIEDFVWTVKRESKEDKKEEVTKKDRTKELRMGEEGYFTLEAAFLVPIVCFLGIGILMLALYLCDMNQAKTYLQCAVSALAGDNEESCLEKRKEAEVWLKENLFVSRVESFSFSQTETKAKGEITICMNLNIPMVDVWMGKQWKNTFSFSVNRKKPVEQMRRWDQIE